MKDLTTRQALLLFAAVSIVVLIPVFVVALPPLVDLPNHLTRCSILAQLPHNPALAALYEPRHTLLPDMAMDSIIVPLAHLMPLLLAGKLFCALTLLVLFSGAFALSWAVAKRATLWTFAPALLLYNHIFSFGFLNYLLGCGLMLWGLALWIVWRERPVWVRIAVGSGLSVVMFVCHLMPLFFYGCAVLGWEIARWFGQPERRFRTLATDIAILGSTFILPFLMLKASPTSSELSRYIADKPLDKFDEMLQILRVDPSRLDSMFTYLVFGAVLLLFATRSIKLDRRMKLPILLVSAAFVALPSGFATTGCVDMRVPILMAAMLVSGAVLVAWRPAARIACAALAIAFGLRMFQITESWQAGQPELKQVVADFAHIPDGSVVFSACDAEVRLYDEGGWAPPILHAPLLAGADRPVFFPQIFALAVQHPLAVRPELADLKAYQGTDPKFFADPDELQETLRGLRELISDPQVLPPQLGVKPGIFVYTLTTPGESLDLGRDAELVVRREHYSLLRLTNLDRVYAARARYWNLTSQSGGLVAHHRSNDKPMKQHP